MKRTLKTLATVCTLAIVTIWVLPSEGMSKEIEAAIEAEQEMPQLHPGNRWCFYDGVATCLSPEVECLGFTGGLCP